VRVNSHDRGFEASEIADRRQEALEHGGSKCVPRSPRIVSTASSRVRAGRSIGSVVRAPATSAITRPLDFSALAPVTILPLQADDVADIAMGFTEVIVTLNADCLAGGLSAKGMDVEIAVPPESGEVFLRATRGFPGWDLTVQVDPQSHRKILRNSPCA
jgi:hypothetical protein